ncbi:hypothetical protein NQ314_020967 [Rhamnusium bicolor]|uniref:DDE-1 domain-containing protein n=1 Tax=Rhamnusium bicolor TaxID=1586634 RepID=A0AAV8WK94_9CUCU|nr:hypothetical protein NQ314_020967 [Rhamnusium bicolor]
MVVYPYQRIPDKISAGLDPTWGIGRSENGWMTTETFYQYIGNVFHPYLLENGVKFPIILFVDGHKSHLTYELSVLCNELKIEVIALYPNVTRIIQPADVAVFRPVKVAWRAAVRKWQTDNPGQSLNKITFAPLLKTVVDSSIKPEYLIRGFKLCGLYPFSADAVDYSKCLGAGSKRTDTSDEEPNNILMDYRYFVSIVGEETIVEFEKN